MCLGEEKGAEIKSPSRVKKKPSSFLGKKKEPFPPAKKKKKIRLSIETQKHKGWGEKVLSSQEEKSELSSETKRGAICNSSVGKPRGPDGKKKKKKKRSTCPLFERVGKRGKGRRERSVTSSKRDRRDRNTSRCLHY